MEMVKENIVTSLPVLRLSAACAFKAFKPLNITTVVLSGSAV